MTLASQRALFAVPDDVCYFNAAYMGPVLRAGVEAGERAIAARAAPWAYTPADFFEPSERIRGKLARLYGASADAVALIPSVSYGLASAARNIPLKRGQTVLILADQFPSNVYIWRERCAEAGAELVTVRRGADESWTEAVLAAIDSRLGLIAVPEIHWIDGGRLDLVRIGAAARSQGAALVLDLTQSLGAAPFDAGAVDPDFAVAAGYKWQLGPYATASLYAAERQWAGRPLEEGWMVRAGSEDFAGLTRYRDEYLAGARRYDMGERPNLCLLPMVEAALDQILAWTPKAIGEALAAYNASLADSLEGLGLEAQGAPDRAAHYLSAALPGDAPDDLLARLAAEKVHISQRGPRLRITPYLHASEADAARFIEALKAALGR